MVDSIQSLNAYGTDPYFMQALGSFNPNFRGANQVPQMSQASQLAQAQATAQVPDTTTTSNVGIDPSFKANPETTEKTSHTGLWVAGSLVTGAAALFYASKKGNGKGIKAGFKNIWNGLTNKIGSNKNNILNKAGKNIQNYTITGENGAQYLFKEGQTKPYQILTQSQTILEGNQLTQRLNKRPKIQELINNLDLTSKDIKTVGRTISDGKHNFQMIYDKNGKVVKVLSQIEGNTRQLDLAKFKEKHGELINKAETFSKNIGQGEISIPNATGFEKITTDLTLNVNGGKLNSINYQNATGTIQEITDPKILSDLENKYSKEITQIMETQGNIPEANRVFEYTHKLKNGTRTYQFNGPTRNITQTTRNMNQTYNKTEKINQILEENNLGQELEQMANSGTIKGNYNLSEFVYQDGNGPTFNFKNNNLESIIDNGTTIKDKDEIKKWLETAEHSNELDKILTLIQ